MSNLVQLTNAIGATLVRLTIGDHSEDTTPEKALDRAGSLAQLHGGMPTFAYFAPATIADVAPPAPSHEAKGTTPAPQGWASVETSTEDSDPPSEPPPAVYSGFGEGNQVQDDAARTRILAVYDNLAANGGPVLNREKTQAGYKPGDRMARIGYDNQEARHAAYLSETTAEEAIGQLSARIKGESREDVTVTAREIAEALTVDHGVKAFGLKVTEQAVRGICARLKSPALSYILGARERIAAEVAKGKGDVENEIAPCDWRAVRADVAKVADVLAYELRRSGDTVCKLRTRKSPGDIFAVLSPTFSPADADAVAPHILADLPKGARATFTYDAVSTDWQVRLNVWTSTPVAEQAVGEPFKGFVTLGARDNGTKRFRGGGGLLVLICLNAGVYEADGAEVSRVHRGGIMADIPAMIREASKCVDALTAAWGTAREAVVEVPSGVTIEQAIPGFWRHLLSDRRSELVGVLPGRSETHIAKLAQAYTGERRDASRVVRADFAQAWTRYAQDFATPVQREAEAAIGAWTVNPRPLACILKDA